MVLEQYRGTQQYSQGGVYCNCCGECITKIELNNQHIDYLYVEKIWGYFSAKDLSRHSFNICERCYDKWIEGFNIPIKEYSNYSEYELDQLNAIYEDELSKK